MVADMRARFAALAVAVACGLAVAPAWGDGASSIAVAQVLYDDAKAAMAKGDYATACQKFAESHRLDPATGGTLLNLAVCHEKMGKTATAWAEFIEAEALAHQYNRRDREKLAHEHGAALHPNVSVLELRVPPLVAHLAGLKVSVDGVEIGDAAWPSIPVDPGDHVVAVKAPGKLPWQGQITVGTARQTPILEIPPLADEPAPPPPPAPHQAAAAEPLVAPASPGGQWHRSVAFVIGGISIAGVAVGSAFGVTALRLNQLSKNNCTAGYAGASPTACGSPDQNGQRALVDANVADVGFGLAIAGLATVTYLMLTAPPRTPSTSVGSVEPRSRTGWRSMEISPVWATRGAALGLSGTW